MVRRVVKAFGFTLLSLGLLATTIVSSYFALLKLDVLRDLQKEGRTVQGVVLGLDENVTRSGGQLKHEYWVTYRYEASNPANSQLESYTRRVFVSFTAFSDLQKSGPVQVTYLPTDPTVAEIKGERDDSSRLGFYSLAALALLTLIALPFTIYQLAGAFRPRRSNDRALRVVRALLSFWNA